MVVRTARRRCARHSEDYVIRSDRAFEPRVSETYVYEPFFRSSVQVKRPAPVTDVFLFTPRPFRWKFCVFDESVTTNVYLPAGRLAITLPSRRTVRNLPPLAVACKVLPPSTVPGTSSARF